MTGLVYGARDVDRPPPNGAVFVSPVGDDGGSGSRTQAVRTWQRAMQLVPDGGTIVARGGDWLTTIEPPWGKRCTIQAAPGERPVISGRRVVTGWTQYGAGLWLKPEWWQVIPHDVPTPIIVDPAHPWAPWPLQVWADDQPLERVATPAEVEGRARFCHVEEHGQLFIGVSPSAAEITVGTVERGFVGGPARVDIKGLTFDGFVTRPNWFAAVIISAADTLLEDVEITRCSAVGVFVNQVPRVKARHLTLVENGQMGGRAYIAEDLEVAYSVLADNNYRRFVTGQAAGAWKADTRSHRNRVHHNLFLDNIGHGFWSDITSDGGWYWRNVGHGGHSLLFIEVDQHAIAAGNYAENMGVGIYTAGSRNIERWNNTYVNCQLGNATVTDSRAENMFGFAHGIYRANNEMHVRTHTDTGAAMLVWHDGHGSNRRTVAAVDFTADGGRYYRRAQECGSVVRASMGLGVVRNFADLATATTMTGLERTGLEHVGPENPFMDPETKRAIGLAKGHGVPLTPVVQVLLGLTAEEAAAPDAGWYGPDHTTTPPLEEQPSMPGYDTTGLETTYADLGPEVVSIIAQVRLLETQLNDQSKEYWKTAVKLNEANETINTLEASLEECSDLLAEANAQVDTLTAERDQLLADLADCEGAEVDPIIVGGSHQEGYQALKTMLGGPPDAFRQFVPASRLTSGALTTIQTVQADGAIPYVSVTKSASVPAAVDDATFNCDEIIRVGADAMVGAIIPIHEPTQKISGTVFKAQVTASLQIYRDLLPNWSRFLCFMRADFLVDPSDPRHPSHYLPDDLSLIDGIAVDLYDKGNADASGDGKTFAWLMPEVEAFALAHDLVIHVLECSAPDHGQRPGNPPVSNPRRQHWKRDFTLGAWAHMTAPGQQLADGRRLYGTFLTFNSTEGADAPGAVPADPTATPPQPEVPAGWRYDTTPDALAALVQVLEASREL